MGLPLLDFLVVLFFLLSLVVVARFRNEIRAHDRESYNYLSGGLAVLAVVALIRIYGGVGLFTTLPFLSDPLFFRVLGWIGIITGATFVVSGVSTWLPLARSHKQYGMERVQRLELIKKVEQLAMVDSRLTEIMSTTLDYMVDLPGVSWGAVYNCSAGSGQATLVTTSGAVAVTVEALQQVEYQDIDFSSTGDLELSPVQRIMRKLSPSMAPPSLVMPLEVNNRVYGAFLLWAAGHDTSDGDEVRVNLKIAIDIIARKIDLDRRRLASSLAHGRRQRRNSLAEVVDFTKDLRENFTAIARLLTNRLQAEFVSLAVAQEDGTVRRLTMGASRTLLDEIGLDLRVEGSHVNHVLSTGKPLMVKCLADGTDFPLEDLAMAGQIGSLMTVPVTCRRRLCAVLTVASRDGNAYEAGDRLLLESAGPILGDLILDERRRGAALEWERRISLMNELMTQAGQAADLRSLFQRVADVLAAELRCSMVRVATCSHDGAFMKSRAVAHDPSVQPATPGDGHLVMSLMPLHQRVRDSGRVLMVNQEDTEWHIAPPEAGQAFFAEVQSAMLVPVKLGQQVLAVIGIADARPWGHHRLRRLDVLFARSLAELLALAIRAGLGGKTIGGIGETEGADSSTAESSQLRGRIKSSLSGIMGSMEMIKSRPRAADPALEKYLSIIDKSAKRINDCFADHVQQ